jgi:uncharacterized protein (TIGR02246 family)
MRPFLGAISMGILLVATGTSLAQVTKTDGQRPLQEIRKLFTEVEESFGRGDAKALAACWTPGGDFSGSTGERIEGRENIEKAFREFLAVRKNATLKIQVVSARVANEGLALVDTLPEVKPPSADDAGDAILSMVLVKRAGRWLIESARETAASRAPAEPPHLKDLEWLVGNWADEDSPQHGSSVRSTCDWTANRAFLIRRFKVEGKGGVERAGTEVIGWDPRARRLRSWLFDTDGGFGENTWVRDGNRWLVRYSGTRPDGSEASATNILTIVDANTIVLQSKDRTAGSELQPEGPKITIKRQSAAPDLDKPGEKRAVEPKGPNAAPQRILP